MLAAPSVSAGNFLLIDYSFRPPFPLLKMRAPPEAGKKTNPTTTGKKKVNKTKKGKSNAPVEAGTGRKNT
jgi:hypothetical protein